MARASLRIADLMSETTRASDMAHRAKTPEDRLGEALEAVYYTNQLVDYVQTILTVADQIRAYQASSGGL